MQSYASRFWRPLIMPLGLFIVLLQCACLDLRGQEAPAILVHPSSITNSYESPVSFRVVVSGTPAFTYQWYKDAIPYGTPSEDTSATNVLYLSSIRETNEGLYSVVITNSMGAVTSSVARLKVINPAIWSQPRSVALSGGQQYVSFSAQARGSAPLLAQWLFKGNPIPGGTNTTLQVLGTTTNAGTYQCVFSNSYGSVTSVPAMFTVNTATVDSLQADADNFVHATTTEADGSILLGGSFSKVASYPRSRLCRLLPHQAVDPLFTPSANGTVYCLLAQPDGKVLVGGAFTTLNGRSRRYLGRLNSDGTLDTNFNVTVNGPVFCMATTPWDGMILAGGQNMLTRFDTNGVVSTFYQGTLSGTIYSIVARHGAPVAANVVYVGGGFTMMAGGSPALQNLACLRENGSIDSLFNSQVPGTIYAMTLHSGGLLLGGSFKSVNGYARTNLAKITTLGATDTAFKTAASGWVRTFAVQASGDVIVGGEFSEVDGIPRQGLVRLSPTGSIDPFFNAPASSVQSLMLQADGKLIVGGSFSSLAGATRASLGRLNLPGVTNQQLVASAGTVRWMRGSGLPRVYDVQFEAHTPASGWFSLGWGTPVSGGWQCTATPPTGATLRVHGRSIGGSGCGSESVVEFSSGPVVIVGTSVHYVASQSYLKVIVAGDGPITYQWFRNGIVFAGGTNSFLTAVPGEYAVLICGPAGCVQSKPIAVDLNGLDASTKPNPDATVYALALQPDGKILVGGTFTNFASTPKNGLARLNPDGTLDTNFAPRFSGPIYCAAVQRDGRILVGGSFTNVNGERRDGLARLSPTGELDDTFVANVSDMYGGQVSCLAFQQDGQILVGGGFTWIRNTRCDNLARLNSDGSVDDSFVPPKHTAPLGFVRCILPRKNGGIFVGGRLSSESSSGALETYQWLGPNGAHLTPGTLLFQPSQVVYSAVELPDGSIIAGGLNGSYGAAVRFNVNRVPETNLLVNASGPVYSLSLQADGKILVGGSFTNVNGVARTNLARLHPDGSVDMDFARNVNGQVRTVLPEPQGKLSIGGTFSSVGTSSRKNYARIVPGESVEDHWDYDGWTLTWTPCASTPFMDAVELENSPDGVQWNSVVTGERVENGWALSGVSLPFVQSARVQGEAESGGFNISRPGVSLTAPFIVTQPLSQTNIHGLPTGFRVVAGGPGPLNYQWYHNGVAIPPETYRRVTGAQGNLLAFYATEPDSGTYWVVVTNLFGSVTSQPASLTTLHSATPPAILSTEPVFQTSGLKLFRFQIGAVPGQTTVVEKSENLRNWSPVKTNQFGSSASILFEDTNPSTNGRFYRVRLK